MTNTSSLNDSSNDNYATPDMNELQNKLIQSIKHFSELQNIKTNDNDFIQKKLDQISEQKVEFRKFVDGSITHSLKMSTHASDLIVFAECCEDNNISNGELLELLGSLLSDAKLNKAKSQLLKNQLERVKISLDEIVSEITNYNEEITRKRDELPDRIGEADSRTDGAWSFAKGGIMTAGIGAVAAIVAAPFTAGASLVAEAILGLGATAILGGTATATVSTVIAGASKTHSYFLNYELRSVREQFSQFLQEMRTGLKNIGVIISHCESHWEKQIIEIEDIIKKLERDDERRLVKTITRAISKKAEGIRKNSENYSVDMRQALNIIQ